MRGIRGLAPVAAVAAVIVAANAAPAQTPAPDEPVAITLNVTPKVQVADFGEVVEVTGKVTGSPALAAALAERTFDLEFEAVALGYDREVDLDPITPRANGSFKADIDVAVGTRMRLRPIADSGFTGASRAVTVRWRPVPEVSNFSRGRKLVMEYRVTVPGGIPFSGRAVDVQRGTAKRAIFYAGPQGAAIPRVASAPLRSAYDGEVHARVAVPVAKLPKLPKGTLGRIYACVKGTPFRGFLPVDRKCGSRRTRGVIEPREP